LMGQAMSAWNSRVTLLRAFMPHFFLSFGLALTLVSQTRSKRLPSHPSLARRSAAGMLSDTAASLENPEGFDLDAFEDSYKLYKKLTEGEATKDTEHYASALGVLTDAFRLYGPECVYGSYNGGKDAVVIMHLMRAALAGYSAKKGQLYRPRLIYFSHPKEFPEVEVLVKETVEAFDLELTTFAGGFVQGLTECVEGAGRPLGFVLGTRKGDPNCGDQQAFAPSSDWMPPFMRVNPILDWTYGQVWEFLRRYDLAYCPLYDSGYTSLGKVDDTEPNPALKKADGTGYLPAYELTDWALERAGRVDKKKSSAEGTSSSALEAGLLSCEFKALDEDSSRLTSAATAGLVVIGDEILSAKTADSNTAFAMRLLRDHGVALKRVAIVGDEAAAIRDEVRRQSQAFDLVVTSGGVGPTHDDVTIKAVAEAFEQKVALNPRMLRTIVSKFGVRSAGELADAQRKMAELPETARLRFPPIVRSASSSALKAGAASGASGAGEEELEELEECDPETMDCGADEAALAWPILQCENVFVLPGVPQFFEEKLRDICAHFLDGKKAASIFGAKVAIALEESSLAAALNQAVARFPNVAFGSYP